MYEASLAFAALCFLLVGAIYWRSPAFNMFHPLTFYLAFHGILFVFRPIVAWTRGYDRIYHLYQFYPSMADKITVIVASSLGLITFAFFSLRSGGQPLRFAEELAIRNERIRLTRPFFWALMISGPLAAYSLLKSYGENNNFAGLTLDKTTGITINTQNIGYLMDMQLMAIPLCAIFIWLSRFRLYSFVPLIFFIALSAGTGGRGSSVAAVASAGLFYLYEKRIPYPGLRVALGAALVLAAFGAVGVDRGAAIREFTGLADADAFERRENQDRFMEGMDFANMEYFEYLVYVIPQRSGTYDYFLDNFQILTEPVPRVLWTGKPVGEPFRRIWMFDYGFPIGMTRSLPGEGWYALGWLGVVIWCGLWGHVLGALYSRFAAGRQSLFKTVAYIVFLPTLIVGLRDGLLLTVVRQTGVYMAPIVLWYLVARYFGAWQPAASQRLAAAPHPAAGRAGDDMASLPPAVRRRRIALAASPPAE